MNVLMLNYEFPPLGGGAGNACFHVLREFSRVKGLRVDLVTSSPNDRYEIEEFSENVRLFKLNVNKKRIHYWTMPEILRWTIGSLGQCNKLLKENRYDVCHCWFGWPSGILGYLYNAKMPYVVSLRGSDIPGYNPRLKAMDSAVFSRISRVVWRNADRVTTLSKDSSEMASRTLDMDFNIIYNGVDTGEFYPGQRHHDGIRLLYVGRLIERKGVDHLLLAMAEIVRSYPDKNVRLTIVGEGNLDGELKALAAKLNIAGHVSFQGVKKHEELPAIYREHDIFILPSINEALSNVILEAIASGLAVVTTNTGAAEFLDQNGLLINKKDPGDIARKLSALLEDPGLVDRFKSRSATMSGTLSWKNCADRYLSLYRNALRMS